MTVCVSAGKKTPKWWFGLFWPFLATFGFIGPLIGVGVSGVAFAVRWFGAGPGLGSE